MAETSSSANRVGPIPLFLDKISSNWAFNFVYTKIWAVVFERRDAAATSADFKYNLLDNIKQILTNDRLFDDKNRFFPNGNNYGIDYIGQYTDSEQRCSPYYHLLDMGQDAHMNVLVDGGRGHFILANKITIPQENIVMTTANTIDESSLGGILAGRVGANRYNNPQGRRVKMSFIDTNFNFAERIVKPWIIACAHRGLVESSELPELKCNIHLYLFAKSSPNYKVDRTVYSYIDSSNRTVLEESIGANENTPYCHSEMIFHDCIPMLVGEKSYNYAGQMDVGETISDVDFSYDYYTVRSNIDNYPVTGNKDSQKEININIT